MLKNSTQPAGGGNVMYPGKVPGKVKYTFAFGALGKDMIYGMIATFSMIYFTDIIKVAPAFIGIMFFSAKIWDAFNDLFMGMLVDNTRSRFGKFIPWLTVGTLINAFVFIILFTDFHLSGIGLCVFAAVAYVLWGMTYTIMDIPYWSIVPNLTSDPHERKGFCTAPYFCQHRSVPDHRRIWRTDHQGTGRRLYRISSFCIDHCRNLYLYHCSYRHQSAEKAGGQKGRKGFFQGHLFHHQEK